jgi:hypothetical protein
MHIILSKRPRTTNTIDANVGFFGVFKITIPPREENINPTKRVIVFARRIVDRQQSCENFVSIDPRELRLVITMKLSLLLLFTLDPDGWTFVLLAITPMPRINAELMYRNF